MKKSLLLLASSTLLLVSSFSGLSKYCDRTSTGEFKLAFQDLNGPVYGSTAQIGLCRAMGR